MSEITPNTPNPVREDEYYEALAAKLGIPASAIPRTPVWRNEEELAALVQLFTNMQGSSGGDGGLLVTITWNEDYDEADLDKTWQEIHDAVVAGKYVSFIESYSGEGESYTNVYRIVVVDVNDSLAKPYGVTIIGNSDDVYKFLSETPNDTPRYEVGDNEH